MPRKPKKTYNFTKPRRRMRRRFRRKPKSNSHILLYKPISHNPFPPEYCTKMTVSAFGQTGTGVGSGVYRLNYAMNSIVYPLMNATTGVTYNTIVPASYSPPGTQILLFNNLYNNCIVLYSKIEFDLNPQSSLDACVVTITPSGTLNVPASVSAALSQPYTRQTVVSENYLRHPNKDYVLSNSMSPAQFAGVSKEFYRNSYASYGFIWTAQPAIPMYWVVNISTGDNTVFNQPGEFRVRITYYCKFFNFVNANLNP